MLQRLSGYATQIYPPKPKFTEEHVPPQDGKVHVVTGANTGVGREVAKTLYSKNAKVYMAARSKEKALEALESIKKDVPDSKGELVFLPLDLADLTTVKKAAEEFLAKETKLHALFNNAGVMNPGQGTKTAQGHELQLGVNNVGPHLLTELLTPALVCAAETESANTVRVVWVSSIAADTIYVPTGGVELENLDYNKDKDQNTKYAISKAANCLQAQVYAKKHKSEGIVSIAANPGNLDSELWRTHPSIVQSMLRTFFLYPSLYGAYTELFAAFSPEVTTNIEGKWVVPFGRFLDLRKDFVAAAKSKEEGGTAIADQFWTWLEQQVKPYR